MKQLKELKEQSVKQARKQNYPYLYGCLAVIVVLLCMCVALPRSDWAKANNAQATATARSDDATSAASFAPTPTETPEQRVKRIIKDAVSKGQVRSIEVNADGVQIDLTGIARSKATDTRDGIYRDVFNVMSRIYTSHLNPNSVTVNVYDSVYDQYGKPTDTLYATVTLTAQTAGKFYWDNLSTSQAWGDYDKAWMRDDIANA